MDEWIAEGTAFVLTALFGEQGASLIGTVIYYAVKIAGYVLVGGSIFIIIYDWGFSKGQEHEKSKKHE